MEWSDEEPGRRHEKPVEHHVRTPDNSFLYQSFGSAGESFSQYSLSSSPSRRTRSSGLSSQDRLFNSLRVGPVPV